MNKIILIFGFGPRIAAGVARAFASKGYKVAVVSRTNKAVEPGDDYLWIQADLSDAFSVEGVFTTVRSKLGIPSVVVYNGRDIAGLTLSGVYAKNIVPSFRLFHARIRSAIIQCNYRCSYQYFFGLCSGSAGNQRLRRIAAGCLQNVHLHRQ